MQDTAKTSKLEGCFLAKEPIKTPVKSMCLKRKIKSSVSSLMERIRKTFTNHQKNSKQEKSLEAFSEYPTGSANDSGRPNGKLSKGLNTTKRLRNWRK
jgi:hypothetical protein